MKATGVPSGSRMEGKKRDKICESGFSFGSILQTFGQAYKICEKERTGTGIYKIYPFDYSYRYFYGDGYGKDYSILNLADDTDEDRRKLYLTACLMSYYQQLKIYEENKRELIPFLLEKNLYLFLSVEQLMRYIEGTKRMSRT